MITAEDAYPVWCLAWDGEPSMSGRPHRMSVGTEFLSFEDACTAAARTRINQRDGFRIETRIVTPWRGAE